MSRPVNRPRVPGTTLLKIARLLFDETVLSAVVQPTISDLQREVADAGPSHAKRLRAQWRGYGAFWRLTIVIPFAALGSPASDAGVVAFPEAMARLAIASIVLGLLAVIGPVLGAWAAGVATVGTLVAIVMHAWYKRHPSAIPAPPEPQKGSPQINFSSTEVAGNVGGLIFAVGSVVIVAIGVPSLLWFMFAAAVAGSVLAWALVAWHARHPKGGLPENQIILR
jgi:hypothetical protein